MAKRRFEDPTMTRIRDRFEEAGLSLQDLGLKMGYPEESARKSAWQLMRTSDPRISMLRRFAKAMKIELKELLC